MLSWYHSGFNVYIGDRVEPDDKAGLGNLGRYIISLLLSLLLEDWWAKVLSWSIFF